MTIAFRKMRMNFILILLNVFFNRRIPEQSFERKRVKSDQEEGFQDVKMLGASEDELSLSCHFTEGHSEDQSADMNCMSSSVVSTDHYPVLPLSQDFKWSFHSTVIRAIIVWLRDSL